MKTYLMIEIDHKKPLPADFTDSSANWHYTSLHAKGVECDVSVRYCEIRHLTLRTVFNIDELIVEGVPV